MRFIHVADVHLGAQPDVGALSGEIRGQELWDTFKEVISVCEREQVDLLLIAGDLFHRQPLMRELKEVDYLFSRLSKTKVVMIAGNHDYIRKDSYYHTFQWSENVYPLFEKQMTSVYFEELDTAVSGFSYYEREIREPRYNHVEPTGQAEFEILLAHGGDEKHIPIRRDSLERLRFDYIALGHIHKPQALIENKAIYAGALEPTDKNDVGEHGYIQGEITRKGVWTTFVPFAKRQYQHLAIKVNDTMTVGSVCDVMQRAIDQRGRQHLYQFTLKGFRDPDNSFDMGLLQLPGNVLGVVDETEPSYDIQQIWEKNRDNLIGKYIEIFDGCEPGSLEHLALQEGILALMKNQ